METRSISLDLIDPPVVVERRQLNGPEFEELVADIRARGLLQPIVVRPVDGRYRVTAGYRRSEACKRAGLLEAPCYVRDVDDAGELRDRARENKHRQNPNPVEEGALFAAMHEGLGLTPARIADEVGVSYGYVRDRLELVQGPENVREAVMEGVISFSVAKELLRCHHDGDRDNLLYHAKRGGCTASLMRSWVDEATVKRASLPEGGDPGMVVVNVDNPPIPLGICEWHGDRTPLDSLLSFRVCPSCYRELVMAREDLKRQSSTPQGGDPDDSHNAT